MQENKILVVLNVPEIDEVFDLYIPVNRKVGNIIELLKKLIDDVTDNSYEITDSVCLYSKQNGLKYDNNSLVYDTDIRNGSGLILM